MKKVILIVTALFLAACSESDPMDDYVGFWRDEDRALNVMEIVRDDEGSFYMQSLSINEILELTPEGGNLVFILRKGRFPETQVLTLIDNGSRLASPYQTFKRIDKKEGEKIKARSGRLFIQ